MPVTEEMTLAVISPAGCRPPLTAGRLAELPDGRADPAGPERAGGKPEKLLKPCLAAGEEKKQPGRASGGGASTTTLFSELRHMARRPRCKHFSGLMNDACDAGVKYDAVKVKNGTGQGYSLPCLPHHNQCGATCEKLSLPTPEEIAAEEAADKKRHEDTGKARAAIVAHLGGPWKKGTPGAYGTIECPVCKQGRLNFRRAGVNGHIHAACEMDGCVNWME